MKGQEWQVMSVIIRETWQECLVKRDGKEWLESLKVIRLKRIKCYKLQNVTNYKVLNVKC